MREKEISVAELADGLQRKLELTPLITHGRFFTGAIIAIDRNVIEAMLAALRRLEAMEKPAKDAKARGMASLMSEVERVRDYKP